jgi:general secretion pathway protein B
MSYILDALKRADTERERGVVPGLYARQVISPSRPNGHTVGARLGVGMALTALALGLVAAGLYFLRSTPERTPSLSTPLVQSQAAPNPLPPAPTPRSAAEPTPAVAAAALPQRPQAALTPAPTQIAPTPVVTPAVPSLPAPRAATALQTSRPASAASTPALQLPALPTTPLLSELSEELRRQIPTLTITGVVFSDAPGQRLLLVNNQVMSQGSLIALELTLIEIGAKSSVFSFRGTRFRLPH